MEGDVAGTDRRRRRVVVGVAVAALVLLSAGWLPLVAGVVWPGTAVLERCDQAAAESFGKESVYAVRGEQSVRWWTPGWHCPPTTASRWRSRPGPEPEAGTAAFRRRLTGTAGRMGCVAAATRRNRVPFWAMPVLAGLPLWAYVYQATLEPAPSGDA